MNIQGPSSIHGAHGIQGPHSNSRAYGAKSAPSRPDTTDEINISPAAEAAVNATEGGEIRADLVARVRSEIAAGTYETAEKLDAALEGLLNELG